MISAFIACNPVGSSPRMRGKRVGEDLLEGFGRIIPAHAG